MKYEGVKSFISPIRSLPLWERGLKSQKVVRRQYLGMVAPLVGAWIEIPCNLLKYGFAEVAPLVGAWIEILYARGVLAGSITVAPLVGAWIEMPSVSRDVLAAIVAPLVGAWIEIILIPAPAV